MSKLKYLVETSAVRPALGSSTTAHNRHFAEKTAGGSLWSSTYIRKEFIHRWVCDMIRIAVTIEQCDNVSDALIILEQDFSPRNVKGTLAAVAQMLRETGALDNKRLAEEEVASLAIRWLKLFDKDLASRIANLCKCQIGGRTPAVDYNNLLDDLHSFHEEFRTPVLDCEVNAFLAFVDPSGRAASLLADPEVCELPVGQKLQQYAAKQTWVTCKECASIGDAIIALEQPPSWCLVHVDRSFNHLCRARDRAHLPLKSVQAINKI